MTRFVKINNSIFKISKTLADSLKKTYSNIQVEVRDKKHFFILNDFILSSFHVVNTANQTHFYILISKKKYRVNKDLHAILVNRFEQNENQVINSPKMNEKKKHGFIVF